MCYIIFPYLPLGQPLSSTANSWGDQNDTINHIQASVNTKFPLKYSNRQPTVMVSYPVFSVGTKSGLSLVSTRLSFICLTLDHHTAGPGEASINSMRPRQNGRYFADDNFKRIFLNENVGIAMEISLKFVFKGPINNISALVQIMAWRHPGDKPLSEPMMVRLPTYICVIRPQ